MPLEDYSLLLAVAALLVTCIFTVSNTRQRIRALASLAASLPASLLAYWYSGIGKETFGALSEPVFANLLVSAVMAVLFEFTPRGKAAGD